MSISYFPVSYTVGRSETDSACAEGWVHLFIGDYLYMYWYIAKNCIVFFPDKFFIPRIVWMYGDRDVANLGFWTRGRHHDREVLAIAECVEFRRTFLVHDLVV